MAMRVYYFFFGFVSTIFYYSSKIRFRRVSLNFWLITVPVLFSFPLLTGMKTGYSESTNSFIGYSLLTLAALVLFSSLKKHIFFQPGPLEAAPSIDQAYAVLATGKFRTQDSDKRMCYFLPIKLMISDVGDLQIVAVGSEQSPLFSEIVNSNLKITSGIVYRGTIKIPTVQIKFRRNNSPISETVYLMTPSTASAAAVLNKLEEMLKETRAY